MSCYIAKVSRLLTKKGFFYLLHWAPWDFVISINRERERERVLILFWIEYYDEWKKKNRYVIHWLNEQTVINHHVICQWQKPWSVYVHRVWNLYQIPKKQFSHNSTNAGIKDQARAITTSCTVSTMTAALIRVQLIKKKSRLVENWDLGPSGRFTQRGSSDKTVIKKKEWTKKTFKSRNLPC